MVEPHIQSDTGERACDHAERQREGLVSPRFLPSEGEEVDPEAWVKIQAETKFRPATGAAYQEKAVYENADLPRKLRIVCHVVVGDTWQKQYDKVETIP